MAKGSPFASIDAFRAAARDAAGPGEAPAIRASFDTTIKAEGDSRTLTFAISTASVDRMGDTIAVAGWKLDAFRKNPVVLWAHDASSLPVAKATKVWIEGDRLMATAEFTPPGIRFNDSVFDMLKAGFLNATSVGFAPLKYAFTDDPQRRYGIDFMEQELLEFSVVPVPANAEALIQARAAGLDTAPVLAWAKDLVARSDAAARSDRMRGIRGDQSNYKCSAARGLPIDESDAWDGPAATRRILDAAGFDGDNPDTSAARRGFLCWDSANPTLRGSYKEPFADIIGGRLEAVAGGLRAAASRLPQTDIPQPVKDEARNVLDAYFAKLNSGKAPGETLTKVQAAAAARARIARKRARELDLLRLR